MLRFFLALLILICGASGSLAISYETPGLSAADRAVLACLSVSGGRLQIECATDATLGMDIAAGQILRADIWQSNVGSTGQWRNGAGTAAMSLGPTTTAVQVWGNTDFAGLGKLKLDSIGDYSGGGITITANWRQAAATYAYLDGIRPRTGGGDVRIYNDLGAAVLQTATAATSISIAGILYAPTLRSPAGSDLRLYAATGQTTKIQEAGSGTDKLYIDAAGNIVLQPTTVARFTTGALWVDSIANAAGTGSFIATQGVSLPASKGLTMAEGSWIALPSGNAFKATTTKLAMVSSPASTFYSYYLWPNDSASVISSPTLRGNSIYNAGSNSASVFPYGVQVADTYGVVTDYVRALDSGGLALQDSAGGIGLGVSSAANFSYRPHRFEKPTFHKASTAEADIATYTQLLTETGTLDFLGIDDAGTPTILVNYP